MAFKGQIIIDTERCKGCGVCVPVCPMKCIALSKNVNGKGYNYTETKKSKEKERKEYYGKRTSTDEGQ